MPSNLQSDRDTKKRTYNLLEESSIAIKTKSVMRPDLFSALWTHYRGFQSDRRWECRRMKKCANYTEQPLTIFEHKLSRQRERESSLLTVPLALRWLQSSVRVAASNHSRAEAPYRKQETSFHSNADFRMKLITYRWLFNWEQIGYWPITRRCRVT